MESYDCLVERYKGMMIGSGKSINTCVHGMFILRVCTSVIYTYITRMTSPISVRYINTEFRYIIDKNERGLTGALHGLDYVLGKLTDYVTPRMVTRYYDAGTVPFSHRYTHLGRFLPHDLRKVACK